jgi:hypothetical protein
MLCILEVMHFSYIIHPQSLLGHVPSVINRINICNVIIYPKQDN